MERIKFPGVEQRVCSTFFEILVTWLFCDFFLLLFFGRLLVQRERKEATQTENLCGFYYYSEGYFCTFVIPSICLFGCISNAQFISSSGKVL